MEKDILKVITSVDELKEINKKLGEKISKDYHGKTPIFIGLLKGCQPFISDLIRNITCHVELDYMSVSSYQGTESTGELLIKKDIEINIENRDIIIVDDIIDTGTTLDKVIKLLSKKNPSSIKTCVLLDKPSGRTVNLNADYVGMDVPGEFVVGYGLDYDGLYRNLPYIGVLKPEVYSK